jgi:hypothetical protein
MGLRPHARSPALARTVWTPADFSGHGGLSGLDVFIIGSIVWGLADLMIPIGDLWYNQRSPFLPA